MFLTELDLKKVTSFAQHIKESDKKVTTRFLSSEGLARSAEIFCTRSQLLSMQCLSLLDL